MIGARVRAGMMGARLDRLPVRDALVAEWDFVSAEAYGADPLGACACKAGGPPLQRGGLMRAGLPSWVPEGWQFGSSTAAQAAIHAPHNLETGGTVLVALRVDGLPSNYTCPIWRATGPGYSSIQWTILRENYALHFNGAVSNGVTYGNSGPDSLPIVLGAWKAMVFTFAGDAGPVMYENGIEVDRRDDPSYWRLPFVADAAVVMGDYYPVDGIMAYAALWRRPLGAAEVADVYAALRSILHPRGVLLP